MGSTLGPLTFFETLIGGFSICLESQSRPTYEMTLMKGTSRRGSTMWKSAYELSVFLTIGFLINTPASQARVWVQDLKVQAFQHPQMYLDLGAFCSPLDGI